MYLGVFGHGPLEQRTATNNVLEGLVGDPPSTLVVGGCMYVCMYVCVLQVYFRWQGPICIMCEIGSSSLCEVVYCVHLQQHHYHQAQSEVSNIPRPDPHACIDGASVGVMLVIQLKLVLGMPEHMAT